MHVIAILNQKGGSGKTTLATHIARGFQIKESTVLLIDSDPQGSAMDWAAARDDQPVPVISIDRPTIDRDIKAVSHGKDYIIIDGAPQVQDLAVSAIKAADLVLIPVTPSPYDIWAASDLVEIIKQRIDVTDGKLKAAFVISRAIRGTKISQEVEEALSGYGLPIFKARTHNRVVYPTSAALGKTCFDDNASSDACTEIFNLIEEIEITYKSISRKIDL